MAFTNTETVLRKGSEHQWSTPAGLIRLPIGGGAHLQRTPPAPSPLGDTVRCLLVPSGRYTAVPSSNERPVATGGMQAPPGTSRLQLDLSGSGEYLVRVRWRSLCWSVVEA